MVEEKAKKERFRRKVRNKKETEKRRQNERQVWWGEVGCGWLEMRVWLKKAKYSQ